MSRVDEIRTGSFRPLVYSTYTDGENIDPPSPLIKQKSQVYRIYHRIKAANPPRNGWRAGLGRMRCWGLLVIVRSGYTDEQLRVSWRPVGRGGIIETIRDRSEMLDL